MHAFDDLDDRARREDAFYASLEWRDGPRQAVLDCIVTYRDAVVELNEATIESLRAALR
jgi:hypothetical protein